MENDGIQPFELRTQRRPGTVRPAETCSGSTKSSSSPARHRRLTKPEISSVETMVARMRKSRLLAEMAAAAATMATARVNTAPPRVIR